MIIDLIVHSGPESPHPKDAYAGQIGQLVGIMLTEDHDVIGWGRLRRVQYAEDGTHAVLTLDLPLAHVAGEDPSR